ncbi:neurofilament medium polypeptide-like [Pleurodeles waltl]|uniref:neurofilament medium polypeptide-like n=1 Tax=Pleurodeles waltl TaxID=8319 RepID=UPI003709A9CD
MKKHVRKSRLEPRWKGPFQVIPTTTTAVKCAGVPNWIHGSHTKRVTCPTEEEVEGLKLQAIGREVPGTETRQREPGGEQAEIEEGEIFSEEETADPFEENGGETSGSDEGPEGDKEPTTGEEAGEPDQRRAFPEADDTGKEKENLIDLLGGEKEAGQSEIVQPLPELVAGPSGENSAKRRQSISPVGSKTKEILKEGEEPKLKEKRKEVSVAITSPSEEKDTAKEQDVSKRESKGDAKLKRKRIPSRRYSGPEWAYTATNDWSDEFLSLSLENEEAEQHFGT